MIIVRLRSFFPCFSLLPLGLFLLASCIQYPVCLFRANGSLDLLIIATIAEVLLSKNSGNHASVYLFFLRFL